MSPHVLEMLSLTSERRRGRSVNSIRKVRKSRLFSIRSVPHVNQTNREFADAQKGKRSLSTCSVDVSSKVLGEKFMLSMQKNHGDKVNCLIKMMGQQGELLGQAQRTSIMQLQARRLRFLFAVALQCDSKSTSEAPAACRELTFASEAEQPAVHLGAEFSQMSLSSR